MMTVVALLPKVREALRISTTSFDSGELTDLIQSAQMDLGIAGVVVPDAFDPLVAKAVITYCKMSFGIPEDFDKLKRSYDEQKAQLQTATGYTTWSDGGGDDV